MQIVIDIPESMYEGVVIDRVLDTTVIRILDEIKNGTVLPKGHGKIVDISKIEYMKALNDAIHNKLSWEEAINRIKNSAPTIIEADKE